MPNVPKVPGVPALSSYSTNAITLLVADAIAFIASFGLPTWGVFRNGVPVIAADNTIEFDFRQDFPVSDYPVEQGAFQSYNKVQLPSDIRMQFSAGGDEANRQNFLRSIDRVMNTTDLYDVVTPEVVYLDYNFTHRDMRRSAKNGAGLIVVGLYLVEIRETASAALSNTQQPGEATAQGVGNIQPQAIGEDGATGNGTGRPRITVHPASFK